MNARVIRSFSSNMIWRKAVFTIALPILFFSNASAQMALHASAIDADQNGIDDHLQTYLRIADERSARQNFQASQSSSTPVLEQDLSAFSVHSNVMAAPTVDTDEDGIRDILEIYGYYSDGFSLRGVKRVVPYTSWEDFKQRGSVDGNAVYQWAATAMEASGFVRDNAIGTHKLIHITEAFDAIRNGYLQNGLPETHYLIQGSPGDTGTIASIIAEILSMYPAETPMIGEQESTVYFTDPALRSSDWDPYTDLQEVMGIFPAGGPQAPATDPLIAAIPSINAQLVGFSFVEIRELSETNGETSERTDVVAESRSREHEHGFSVSVGAEVQFGTSNTYTVSTSVTQSNAWSFASSTGTEVQNSFGTLQESSEVTSENCFAKLGLTIDVKNVGSDKASAVQPKLYINIGDSLWTTLDGEDVLGAGEDLGVGETTRVTVLGQAAGDAACLTLNEANFLSQGGTLAIHTDMTKAQISFLNERTGIIDSGGNWGTYRINYEENMAKIVLNVSTSDNTEINRTFWVRAYDAGDSLANMQRSIKEVLEKAYTPINCNDIGEPGKAMCLQTEDHGYFTLGESSQLDFMFFDSQSGEAFNHQRSGEALSQITGQQNIQDNNYFDISLPKRSVLTIFDNTSLVPEVTASQVISRTSDTGLDTIEVRATVQDFFGIQSVEFCLDENDCIPMNAAIDGQAEQPKSGYFSIVIEDYAFSESATEFIKVSNINDKISTLSPDSFYLNLLGTLSGVVDGHLNRLDEIDTWLGNLAAVRRDDPVLYQEIISAGLMETEESANATYNLLYSALQKAKDACGYINPVEVTTTQDLAEQRQSCINALVDYQDLIEQTSIRIYNPYKTPLKNQYTKTFDKISNTSNGNGPTYEVFCTLGSLDLVTGIGLRYKAGNVKWHVGTELYYRTIERTEVTNPLFKWSDKKKKTCGAGGREKGWISDIDYLADDNMVIRTLVDFGWSVGRGNVEKFCAVYREFNLATGKFSQGYKDTCNGNWGGYEGFSNNRNRMPNQTPGPVSHAVNGTFLKAKYSRVQNTHVRHTTPSLSYKNKFDHGLIHGSEYRIRNKQGQALTLIGNQVASRTVALETPNGSDEQVWIVEVMSDYDVRLRPKTYDGFLSRPNQAGASGKLLSVTPRIANDDITANHNEHWVIRPEEGGFGIISSVLIKRIDSRVGNKIKSDAGSENTLWNFEPIEKAILVARKQPTNIASGERQDVDGTFSNVLFASSQADTPLIFAATSTFNSNDPAGVRIKQPSREQFDVKVEEEQSGDNETTVTNPEAVSYLALANGDIVNSNGIVIGEAGSVNHSQLNKDAWVQQSLSRTYIDPVVIMMLNSANDSRSATVRLRSVNSDSFEFQIEKWYHDRTSERGLGAHGEETLAYMVVEKGSHLMIGNRKLQAFDTEVNHNWTSGVYPQSFTAAPIVISQSQTLKGIDPIVIRQNSVASYMFNLRLQEEEGGDNAHTFETVGTIAFGEI